MRAAFVSGDGLPVSGLLTIFRNVVEQTDRIDLPITADLGYSWRPDKAAFYPDGRGAAGYPAWMAVTDVVPAGESAELTEEWLDLRTTVAAADELDNDARIGLWERIEKLAQPYCDYFTEWFDTQDIDWVVAVNMTLSDAVPVTVALHRAAERRWGGGRPGGVVFWDHDLFQSYSVYEGPVRVYPRRPNEFTPVPQAVAHHRWIVPTQQLADETGHYPTSLRPTVIPYVLPEVVHGTLTAVDHEFLAQQRIEPGRPVILAPVRVFRVKGVEVATALIAAVRAECRRRLDPLPHLLVFGTLDEDSDYTAEVLAALGDDPDGVRFLGGVPMRTFRDLDGCWHLDEVDLLRVAAATSGGVFYTPNRPDVESVGLGPALASVAEIPFAATAYNALRDVYGDDLHYVHVTGGEGVTAAATVMAGWLAGLRDRDPEVLAKLATNHATIRRRFPDGPTQGLLLDLRAVLATRTPR